MALVAMAYPGGTLALGRKGLKGVATELFLDMTACALITYLQPHIQSQLSSVPLSKRKIFYFKKSLS